MESIRLKASWTKTLIDIARRDGDTFQNRSNFKMKISRRKRASCPFHCVCHDKRNGRASDMKLTLSWEGERHIYPDDVYQHQFHPKINHLGITSKFLKESLHYGKTGTWFANWNPKILKNPFLKKSAIFKTWIRFTNGRPKKKPQVINKSMKDLKTIWQLMTATSHYTNQLLHIK